MKFYYKMDFNLSLFPFSDFSTVGFCPFGERCSFIHYKRDPEDILKSSISSDQLNVPSFYSTQSLRYDIRFISFRIKVKSRGL